MADEAIRQHQKYARGDGLDTVPAIESPFKQVAKMAAEDSSKSLRDHERGVGKGVKHTPGMLAAQRAPDHGKHK